MVSSHISSQDACFNKTLPPEPPHPQMYQIMPRYLVLRAVMLCVRGRDLVVQSLRPHASNAGGAEFDPVGK